ncbi:MAG: hypothetical protein HKM24_03920, partial [Gammaproteobacteria bacterium]|nr:hypothetical protein [Gammaproteobacteria bacterium]
MIKKNKSKWSLITVSKSCWWIVFIVALASCGGKQNTNVDEPIDIGPKPDQLIEEYNQVYPGIRRLDQQAHWIQTNFRTKDAADLATFARHRLIDSQVDFANRAREFDKVAVSEEAGRALDIIRRGGVTPMPRAADKRRELNAILTRMRDRYIARQFCSADQAENATETSLVESEAEADETIRCLDYATLT